ncbi:MAG: hypothetical protein KC435_12705 [Thermomicrobiales bacterium]|nr:hypothetical protein [Thermomicrobiales bacterium]
MPQYSGQDDHPHTIMPDLPGDPYGRDTDLYPPVQEFMPFDYWAESNLDANFDQRSANDMVVQSRFSELPNQAQRETTRPQRRRAGHRLQDGHPSQMRSERIEPLEIVYDIDDAPAQQPRRTNPPVRRRPRLQRDEVVETSIQTRAISADVVTSVAAPARRRQRQQSHRQGNGAWKWSPIVLPGLRDVLEQCVPTMVMAFSLLFATILIERLTFLTGVWALFVLAPSVALYAVADSAVHPLWKRSALLNLAAVGVFYPLLIVRQSYLRVPFVEWGNGTLTMPLISTLTVVLVLGALALAAAWMSVDDPEYAGVLFLPAAMLVPFFAGATEIVSLRTALIIATIVFLASSVLTVVASMLPSAYPMLVAPVALALEFLVLPLADSSPIFPTGAGTASKLLFFVLLATTVGLTVGMPSLANWVRSVRDLVRYGNGEVATVPRMTQ